VLSPGARLGPYEIVGPLGAGGMGEVYRARDTKLGRDVALKVLPEAFTEDADRLARFEREAKVLASLNHPHIAQIYGLEDAEAQKALVLELVDGATLADRIAQGRIPLDEALPIAKQIAEALEAAHEQGIIHRDLKPANVKVKPDGTVKVLDFGLAKAFEPEGSDPNASQSPTLTARATQMGIILGTAAYMSPEQARAKPVDKRADIWAFGVVLYEMLTGRRAFVGEDVSMTLADVMKSEPDWSRLPGETPQPIRRLLRRCLEKSPERRLRDVGDARLEIEELQSGRAALDGSRDSDAGVVAGRGAPRPRLAALLLWAAGVAFAGVALGFVLVRGGETRVDRVLRYQLPLPRGLIFNQALSPDGRHVAVQGVVARTTQIFVRGLDSWALEPIPGAEGGDAPFWSPDGRFIAFFADGMLKKVPVLGGPATELCQVPGLVGTSGTWGRNGVIIFSSASSLEFGGQNGRAGTLHSVAATGGQPTQLGGAGPGEGRRFPVFLPDGDHFLYTRVGGASPGIYVASLSDSDGRLLLADESSARLAPAVGTKGRAQLLFIRSGRLMAQPLDAERLELRGDPTTVLEHPPYTDSGAAAISVSDTGILSWLGGGSRESDSRTSWFDRSGKRLSDVGSVGPPAFASLSPDGKALLSPRREASWWDRDLYVRDLGREVEERLTVDGNVAQNSNAVWSPDGNRVLFSARSGGPPQIFWKDVRSSRAATPLLETGNAAYVTDWSRDGRYVLYTELDRDTLADLWYLPVQMGGPEGGIRAGDPVRLLKTEFHESFGQLSPDGKWFAYVSDESGRPEIYLRPFPSGVTKWKISQSDYAEQPRWRADGRELFFIGGTTLDRTLMSVEMAPSGTGSSDPPFRGSPQPLFEVRANSYHPATGTFFYAVSPDGQRFLVNHIENTDDPVLNIVTNWEQAFGLDESR